MLVMNIITIIYIKKNSVYMQGGKYMNKKPVIPFKGTKAQEKELRKFIEEEKGQPGALMPALQKAQEIYGYLPIEIQTIVADMLELSLSEVYGVATFYSQFSLNPKGEHRISICLGTACYVKGADKIMEALEEKLGIKVGECTSDGVFSLDSCRCVGACGLAPVMMVDDDVYGRMTVEQIDGILSKYDPHYQAAEIQNK